MTAVRILRLMPELLQLNGSLGNAEVLATRASWFGAEVSVENAEAGSLLTERPDIVAIGHGTSSTLAPCAEAVQQWRATLKLWHDQGVVFVGTGLGGDLLGQSVSDTEGTEYLGVALTAIRTKLGGERFSGEVAGRDDQGRECAGYLNDHTIRQAEGSISPLVTLDRPGLGQWTGATAPQSDGVVSSSVWVSALSGPVLALNPHLADDILRAVWARLGSDLPNHSAKHQKADHWAAAARSAMSDRLG